MRFNEFNPRDWVHWLGFYGCIMSGVCGLPQLLLVHEQGHADGLSLAYMSLVASAVITGKLYVLIRYGIDPLFVFNLVSFLCINGAIFYYMLR